MRRNGPAFTSGRAGYTLLFLALIFASAAQPGRAQNASTLDGRTVVGLQLQCDCNLKLKDFPGAVIQQIGEPLDPAKLSASLKRLYSSGRFADLRAEGAPEANGVAVTFIARAQYFVGTITAAGNPSPIEARALVTASRLRLGQPLTELDLTAAHKRLNDLLVANGYYRSSITHKIVRDPNTLEANITFDIVAGPPARVSSIQFIDDSGFPPERLMKVSGWHPRLYLTAAKIERGLYRLRQFYTAHGRLQANINVQQRIYDAKTNTEKLAVKAQGGPLLRVRVEGASISSSQLHNLLPIYHDGAADDQALVSSSILLEGYFQQKGYFTVKVAANRKPLASPQPYIEIIFNVKLGPHGDFAGFGVKGNKAVPTPVLLSTISPPTQGLFPPAPTFSQDLMDQKVATLLALYQSRGYLDVRITPEIEDDFNQVSGRRHVDLVIHEGPRTMVHHLTLTGIDSNAIRKIWPSLESKPTRPYSLDDTHADRDSILDYLADHGYTHATVNWRTAAATVPHQVDVEFQIALGDQDHVKRIVILGDEHVRTSLVKRELVIHQGEPVNQSAVQDSQRQLYDLGIFNQVQITPQDQPASDTEKTMLVGLEESRRWVLGYGGGFEVQRLGSNTPEGSFKASPRASLELTRLDVGGRGQTFSMGGRLSNIDTGANMGYLVPRLFNRDDLSLRINGLVDRSRDVLTFIADRKEASISVEKRFSASTLLIGRYSFSRLEALDIADKVSGVDAEVLGQPQPVGLFGGSFVMDHRDDPSDATRGSYTLVDAGVSSRYLGSLSSFLRFTGQNSTYYTLNTHLVFARTTQFGVVSPYGSLYSLPVPASNGQPATTILTDAIPLPERFFMGGSESMRGFSINQAGPRDLVTGYPIGGNALFRNSFELRTYFAQRRLGLVLFQDSGNIYSSIRRMYLFKIKQDSLQDFDYTSHAVGLGLRYKTPVGPIRFDVGYNLNPPKFLGDGEVQRLSNVQFFLSIGQSF